MAFTFKISALTLKKICRKIVGFFYFYKHKSNINKFQLK